MTACFGRLKTWRCFMCMHIVCCRPTALIASPAGDLYFPSWEIRKNETSLRALAPCQSLGAYYVRPTPPVMKFLSKLSDWVVNTHTQQWDQAAWNEVGYPCSQAWPACLSALQQHWSSACHRLAVCRLTLCAMLGRS